MDSQNCHELPSGLIEQNEEDPYTALFDCLSHPRRRQVLAELCEQPQLTVTDLARYVVEREGETLPGATENRQAKSVYIELYHCHLPKLATAGIITFNTSREIVELEADPAWWKAMIEQLPGITSA